MLEAPPWFSFGLAALVGGTLAASLFWALANVARSRVTRGAAGQLVGRARYGMSRRRIAEASFEEMRNTPWC